MTEENKSMDKGRKLLIGLIIVLLLLTAGAYFFGVYYFTGHFLPGSQVNGFNCSYMTEDETENLLKQKTAVYVLAVRTRGDGQEGITAEEINLQYTSDGSVRKLLHDQNRFIWFLAFSQQQTYELPASVSYDEELFKQKIDSLKCLQNNVEPEDAYIRELEDGFEVVPEIEGTKIDYEKLTEDISDAVKTGRTVADLEEDGCYINPTAYASDLTKDCEQMNDLTDVVVTYDFSDRKETVDRSVIKGMLGRDENDNLVVSKDAVAAYVANLAGKYDTAGTERTFSTYDNRWVIDQQKESNALYKDITEKKTEVREPVYEQKAASRKINDIGYSYIEIDLSAQRMVLYQSGSPVVDTGLVADSSTPTGIYALGEKESSAVPGGGAGETVNFWMPFTDKIGIYGKAGLDVTGYDFSDDADIAAFGSDDESSGTSVFSDSWPGIEGCIAVPEEQAQAIYQTVESGIPVVIYK